MEKEFVSGIYFKEPSEKVKEFKKVVGSINREQAIAWLQSKDEEWIEFDVLVSRSGKWYGEVNNWKKEKAEREAVEGKPENPYKEKVEYPDDNANPEEIPF